MIITESRRLWLWLYDTQAEMETGAQVTGIGSVVDGTPRLEHTFFTALPARGECNAAQFSFESGVTLDLTGKYIIATFEYRDEGESTSREVRLFAGKIDSCKYDKYKATRSIVAYDRMYELSRTDVSTWWAQYWANKTGSVSGNTVIADMCTAFGVTLADNSTPTFAIYSEAMKTRPLSAVTFTQVLQWIGEVYGATWHIDGYGRLNFISYRSANTAAATVAADDFLDTENSEIADAVTSAYAQTLIYDGSDVLYSNGSGQSFAITDNPLLAGRNSSQYAATGDYAHTATVAMQGFTAATIEASLAQVTEALLSTGNTHTPIILTTADGSTTRRHLVSRVTVYGSQLVDQTFTCTGETRVGASYSASQNKVLNDLTAMGTQITYKVNADAVIEAVNLEAQGGVQINAEALNINGVQSTGGKLKVGVNGDVEVDGKITSSNGEIGGWAIGSGMISKTVTVSGYEYRVLLYAPASPNTGVTAIGIQKRAVGASTWGQVSRFTYGGTLESTDAKFNGRLVINPDMGAMGAGEHVFEIHDTDNDLHMMIDPAYILFTEGASLAADTSLSMGATSIAQRTDDPSQGYPRTEAQFIREIYAWAQSQHEYFREIYKASASSEDIYEQHRTPRKVQLTHGNDETEITATEITTGGKKISHGDAISTAVTTSGNLNNYKTGGVYHAISGIANISNCPASSAFMLEVFAPTSSIIYQRLTEYNPVNMYIRSYRAANDTWSAWQKVTTSAV